MKKMTLTILLSLMSIPFSAFAVESVTCSEGRSLDANSPIVSATAHVTYQSILSRGFTLKKVGVIGGVNQYQLTDDRYGTRASFYTLTVQNNVLTFVSPQEDRFGVFSARVIVLNSPNSGQSFSQHLVSGGYEGPGGPTVDHFMYQRCDVQ